MFVNFARVSLCTCILTVGFSSTIYAEGGGGGSLSPHTLCKKYLDTGGARLEKVDGALQKMQPFFQILGHVLKNPDVQWPSDSIQPNRLVTPERAMQLSAQLKDNDSVLGKEMMEHILSLGNAASSTLWDKYFTAYDRIVGYAQGFWDIAFAADEILPKFGRIADYGAGTGNVSTLLGLSEPGRYIDAFDFSAGGLKIAQEKFQLVPGANLRRLDVIRFDLLIGRYPENVYDGAVMNNVLYNFKGQEKLIVLKKIFASLKPGAPFVLHDIVDAPADVLVRFMESTLRDAMMAGAPITEYDLALMAKINISVLLAGQFLTLDQLQDLAREAGFEVRGAFKSYYDVGGFLYLTKPNLVTN